MLPLLLLACVPPTTEKPAPTDTGPTYYADVRPILDQSCARCHSEGALAWSMDDPASVQSMAAAMATAVTEGRMPPAAPDPTCRDYESSERFTITDEQKALISTWAEAGAPLGDPADAPDSRDTSLQNLPVYDVELWAAQAYTPTFGRDGNDYRCYLIDVGNTEATYITGMQALIDNMAIVHHVVLFDPATTDNLWGEGDPHDGFSCSGLGQSGWNTLAAWGPGANPTVLPDGMGIPLEANAQIILQMHYFDSFEGADEESDQSGYGLTFTDSVSWQANNYAFGPTSFSIDAGDAESSARDMFNWSGDAQVLAVWPHMHVLGASFEEKVHHAADDTEECLLRMNDWDFHNQVTANLLEPVWLADGDRLTVRCQWDNSTENPNQTSDPPVDVGFGEGTLDEMCFGFTLVATEVP